MGYEAREEQAEGRIFKSPIRGVPGSQRNVGVFPDAPLTRGSFAHRGVLVKEKFVVEAG